MPFEATTIIDQMQTNEKFEVYCYKKVFVSVVNLNNVDAHGGDQA